MKKNEIYQSIHISSNFIRRMDKFFEMYAEYFTCKVCKTTYHLPTLSAMKGTDFTKIKDPVFSCYITGCPMYQKQIDLSEKSEFDYSPYEVLKGMQDLYRDYLDLKKMESDFKLLNQEKKD